MSSGDSKTIVVIGLSGAGLSTFHRLVESLYSKPRPKVSSTIRLIAIEKFKFAYWPPAALRAAVVGGYEENVSREFGHILPDRIKRLAGDRIKVVTGREVVEVDFVDRVLLLSEPLDEFGIEGGSRLGFDYLVIASGSSYPFPCRPPSGVNSAECLKAAFRELQQQIEGSESMLIVGGGRVGIELAGEVSHKHKHKRITLACSSAVLLPEYSRALAGSLEKQLLERGVEIVYGHRALLKPAGITKTAKLDKLTTIALEAKDGSGRREVKVDFVFLATGNVPNSSFVPDRYLNPKTRQIRVNASLQMLDQDGSHPLPGVYALGDVADFEESKVYTALNGQAHTVTKNLFAELAVPGSGKAVRKSPGNPVVITLGPSGGSAEVFGYGLGPSITSIWKGKTLLVGLFRSMYPDQDPEQKLYWNYNISRNKLWIGATIFSIGMTVILSRKFWLITSNLK